jgi:hypothetical protein
LGIRQEREACSWILRSQLDSLGCNKIKKYISQLPLPIFSSSFFGAKTHMFTTKPLESIRKALVFESLLFYSSGSSMN